jgi:outer membrane biosynthesis protein TonB
MIPPRGRAAALPLLLMAFAAGTQGQISEPGAPLEDRPANTSLIVEHAEVPLYPDLARAARLSGEVHIRVEVKNGAVVREEVESLAHPIFVNAAIENVKTWRFRVNASGLLKVTYVYQLDKEESDLPENPRVEMELPVRVKITARPTKPTTLHSN